MTFVSFAGVTVTSPLLSGVTVGFVGLTRNVTSFSIVAGVNVFIPFTV